MSGSPFTELRQIYSFRKFFYYCQLQSGLDDVALWSFFATFWEDFLFG